MWNLPGRQKVWEPLNKIYSVLRKLLLRWPPHRISEKILKNSKISRHCYERLIITQCLSSIVGHIECMYPIFTGVIFLRATNFHTKLNWAIIVEFPLSELPIRIRIRNRRDGGRMRNYVSNVWTLRLGPFAVNPMVPWIWWCIFVWRVNVGMESTEF